MKRYSTKKEARKTKVRAKLRRFADRPRLSVFRSHKYIYAQIIDDKKRETLVSADSKKINKKMFKDLPDKIKKQQKRKLAEAYLVGKNLAGKALKKKIKKIYFDRGCYKYHGRVKALAQGARDGGLNF